VVVLAFRVVAVAAGPHDDPSPLLTGRRGPLRVPQERIL